MQNARKATLWPEFGVHSEVMLQIQWTRRWEQIGRVVGESRDGNVGEWHVWHVAAYETISLSDGFCVTPKSVSSCLRNWNFFCN